MYRLLNSALALVLFCLSAGTYASYNCNFIKEQIRESNWLSTTHYDVFSKAQARKQFVIQLRRSNKNARPSDYNKICALTIKLSPIGPTKLTNGLNILPYRLRPIGNQMQAQSLGLQYQRENVRINEQVRRVVELVLVPQQFVAPGIYKGEILLEIIAGNNIHQEILENRIVPISIEVKSATRIHFLGTPGRNKIVDFGELRQGTNLTQTPYIVMQSTTQFTMSIYSEHKGNLRHSSGATRWDIPYQAYLGNRALDLTSGSSQLDYNQPTKRRGIQSPLRFQVMSITQRPAGSYQDLVRIEITPRELTF